DDANRVLATLNLVELLLDDLAEQDDAGVALAEMLPSSIGYRALAYPGHLILLGDAVGEDLAVLVVQRVAMDRRHPAGSAWFTLLGDVLQVQRMRVVDRDA